MLFVLIGTNITFFLLYFDCNRLLFSINNAIRWSIKYGLPLNFEKTAVRTFTRKTNFIYCQYNFNDKNKSRHMDSVQDLGVIMYLKLLFTEHIDKMASIARPNFGLVNWIFRKHGNYCNLVRPHLEYASVIWNQYRLNTITKLR